MKKFLSALRKKCTVVNMANLFAIAMVITTVNSACYWAHHQPEVPEDALKFRKF